MVTTRRQSGNVSVQAAPPKYADSPSDDDSESPEVTDVEDSKADEYKGRDEGNV